LGLYTSAEAKRIVPGLFVGSITAMAEASKLAVDDTMRALDTLLEREMVEFDRKHRVLRLTVLPDGLESPPNGNVILGWYKRFKSVPQCPVRDAHVTTLRWIMDAWSRESGKPVSDRHQQSWNDTFGLVVVPVPRRRGVRRLLDEDTSTDVQPSLFDLPKASSTVRSEIGRTTEVPSSVSYSLSQLPETPIRETVSKPFANGSDPDPDPDQDLDQDQRSLISDPESNCHADIATPEQIPPLKPPALELVPLFTIGDMLAAIAFESGGRFTQGPVDERLVGALSQTVSACETHQVGLDDLRLVGRWLAHGALGFRSDLGPVWISRPGVLLDCVGQAKTWRDRGEGTIGNNGRRALPSAEPSQFAVSGRRTL
jgi:hypothetical protein